MAITDQLRSHIAEYFVGKEDVIDNVLVCLLAGGHVLLEDVPGVGKTTLARLLAGFTGCSSGRIQFTPDTLPSDVTGTMIYHMDTGEFTYREGAVMHQILLADEINRTSPKTQASLLEAMAEGHVTLDGREYPLPQPFMVIATQNPMSYIGTWPLPEAQLDRFMMRLSIGYPDEEAEIRMAKNHLSGKMEDKIPALCGADEILAERKACHSLHVSDSLLGYTRDVIEATRKESSFVLGASPRAYLALIAASQARAFLEGRDFVKPDDVKAVAVPVLHHRVTLTSEARIRGEQTDRLLEALILKVRIPME